MEIGSKYWTNRIIVTADSMTNDQKNKALHEARIFANRLNAIKYGIKNMKRAELGIDGNCGFALLGENIQEGDCEFVEIDEGEEIYSAQRTAATRAYKQLKERHKGISYFLGESHPDYL